MEILECVPNISEGRNISVIQHLAKVISSVQGIRLLHVDSGKATNRTVFTFIGAPDSVIEAAYQLFVHASQIINMQQHLGEHPRVGVVDVCPLIPLRGISIDKAKMYAEKLAKRVGENLDIPVYMYEQNARHDFRRNLEQIRAGEYEGFYQKMQSEEWKPDFGPQEFNIKTGACIIGVRNFLLAYNVNLKTKDVTIAKNIAALIRESGGAFIDSKGNKQRSSGLFKGVKAIGWYIKDFDVVQVSTNITDFKNISMFTVYSEIARFAKLYNTEVRGSELIGLVPLAAIQQSANEIIRKSPQQNHNNIQIVSQTLNLSDVKEFIPEQQILEYVAKIL